MQDTNLQQTIHDLNEHGSQLPPCSCSLERLRFFTVNAKRSCGIPLSRDFGSPTHMQAKKILRFTRPVCCVSVVLNVFVNSVHTLKHIPFTQTVNKITPCYTFANNCLNLIY